MNRNCGGSSHCNQSSSKNTPDGEVSETETEQEWQRAQGRLLLYLQMLQIPAVETLELALEALRRAKQEVTRVHSNPIAESMRALHRLLLEQTCASSFDALSLAHVRTLWMGQHVSGQVEIRSMPPLNRGSIIPERDSA